MAHFLQDRSCNDDFYHLANASGNSNENNMDTHDNQVDSKATAVVDELDNKLKDINLTSQKRKRENTQFYAFARAQVNEGEMYADEAEMDPDYCDYAYASCCGGGGMDTDFYDQYDDYDYDENAMIQEDQEEVEYDQDEELFQMNHKLPAADISMDLSESEEDEINADFDELQRLRDELAMLREETMHQRVAFPEGSSIRFVMVAGVRYLQVFQEALVAAATPPMSIDELNCDADADADADAEDYDDF